MEQKINFHNHIGPIQYFRASYRTMNTFNIPYDYFTVMHYSKHKCAPENGDAFTVKGNIKGEIGQAERLTNKDYQHINRAYCPGNVT